MSFCPVFSEFFVLALLHKGKINNSEDVKSRGSHSYSSSLWRCFGHWYPHRREVGYVLSAKCVWPACFVLSEKESVWELPEGEEGTHVGAYRGETFHDLCLLVSHHNSILHLKIDDDVIFLIRGIIWSKSAIKTSSKKSVVQDSLFRADRIVSAKNLFLCRIMVLIENFELIDE